MSHYVDGFVVPVPRSNLDAYVAMARRAGAIWKEHGALQYWECVGDDVKPGKVTSFPQAVQLKDDEIVVFSWIVYDSRADRDRINEKVDVGPAPEGHDGSEDDAVRRHAHVLGRLRVDRRAVTSPAAPAR